MLKTSSILPSNAITSEDILGKDVLDADGVSVGIVDRLYLDPGSVDILGFSIDKGFLRDGLLVGTKHISEITPHAIFLNIRPAFRLQGSHVFDKDGELVGSIKEVALDQSQNSIEELVVKKRFKKSIIIPGHCIDSLDENIILNCNISELPR
jgi:sporulation protein YlmC with PRC-barrel domain